MFIMIITHYSCNKSKWNTHILDRVSELKLFAFLVVWHYFVIITWTPAGCLRVDWAGRWLTTKQIFCNTSWHLAGFTSASARKQDGFHPPIDGHTPGETSFLLRCGSSLGCIYLAERVRLQALMWLHSYENTQRCLDHSKIYFLSYGYKEIWKSCFPLNTHSLREWTVGGCFGRMFGPYTFVLPCCRCYHQYYWSVRARTM